MKFSKYIISIVLIIYGLGSFSKLEAKQEHKPYGYLLTYVSKEDTERKRSLHIAVSRDGVAYTSLNGGKGILYPLAGSKKMRTPSVFRNIDGTFGLIASDNQNSGSVILFDSNDLTTYTNERLLILSETQVVKNPVCSYDEKRKIYAINWIDENGKRYESLSRDLKSLVKTVETDYYPKSESLRNIPESAMDASVIPLTEQEYNIIVNKYASVYNTGVEPLQDVIVKRNTQATLPDRVSVKYSDGGVKSMPVEWSASDIVRINTSKPGVYEIKGEVKQTVYGDPFIERRADPYVVKGSDGYYYFTASYPKVGGDDPEGYDRVILRRSATIEGLKSAEEIVIWQSKNSSISYPFVWAPEIHEINGQWYVFFTTSRSKSNTWDIRPIVIACNKGEKDPINPNCWEENGHYSQPVVGDSIAFNHFSLDMTYFENQDKHYVVWAEKPQTSNIMIASIDPQRPWILTSKSVLLSTPEYGWEWKNWDWINEGPAIIKHDNRIYLAYSASSVDEAYCVGLLHIDKDSDPLDAKAWTKEPYPLLSSEDLNKQNGPGHNSFTTDEFGNPVIVYHARTTGEICGPSDQGNGGLFDPGRHARIKSVYWKKDGLPVLNMTNEEELDPLNKNVSIKVVVVKK